MRTPLLSRTLAIALGATALVVPARGSAEDAARLAARADGIMQSIRAVDGYDVAERRALVETIAELPREDRPAIVYALARMDGDGQSAADAAVILDVLDHLGPTAVTALLTELGGVGSTRHDRALVFWFARSQGAGAGLDVVLSTAAACGAEDLRSPRIRGSIRDAVVAELHRAGLDWADLGRRLRSCEPALQETILDAVEAGGFRVSTRALSGLLGAHAGADDAGILRRLARLPVREATPLDAAAVTRLPDYLRHDDAAVRRLAIIVAARYRSQELALSIIGLLDDDVGAVAATSHRVLREISGARLVAESALWRRWYEGERGWMEKQGPRIEERLESGAPADIVAALRTVTAHPLFADDHLPAIHTAAGHADTGVRRQACAALAKLGRLSSIPVLARRLGDDDPGVASTASKALAQLTGLSAPVIAAEWHDELLLDD